MIRSCIRMALVLAIPATLAAQPRGRGPTTDEQTLLRLEDDWAVGVVKRDAATFQRIIAARFVYTENDQVMTRDDVLHDVVSGTDTATAAHNEDMKVHLFGSTGVVTGWLIIAGRGKGGPFNHRYRFTDTWVKTGDNWQIVAAQDYLAPTRK